MVPAFWAVLLTCQECQVYMFFQLNKKKLGMNLLELSPSFGQYWSLLSTLSNTLRIAPVGAAHCPCTPVHEEIPLPAMPPVSGVAGLPWQSWSEPQQSYTARQGLWNVPCAGHGAGQFLVLSNLGWRVLLLKSAFLLHVVRIKTSLQPPS